MSRRTDFGQRSEGTRYEHSASDNVRFDSFIGWRGLIDKESLVDVGFSYTGEEDAVRCDWCQSVIRDWTKDMDPLVEHVKRAPDCNYLTQLIPAGDLAEMKDQIFDITKMRAPTDGAFTWPCNNLTGERVDEEVQDCMCIRASQQSVEQHTEPDPDNEESNRDAIRSVDMFPNGSEVRETCVQIGASGDGRRVAEKEPHPDTGMPVENIPPRGELYQDAITHGVNEDDNMDHMMQGTAAQSVLQTGYGTEDDVRNAIIDLRRNGKEDFNGEDIMRLIDGTGSYSNELGERVDEEVEDCMCRASQQSVEQHTEPDPDNKESNRDVIRSVDMFPNGSEVRVNCVLIGASGDGRRVAETEPHPDTGMLVENIPARGELYQDAGTHGVNEDDNMDHMMQGTAAQSVLQTGYGTEDDVRNAIIDLRRNGKEDFNGEDIMKLIDGTGSYSNELDKTRTLKKKN